MLVGLTVYRTKTRQVIYYSKIAPGGAPAPPEKTEYVFSIDGNFNSVDEIKLEARKEANHRGIKGIQGLPE